METSYSSKMGSASLAQWGSTLPGWKSTTTLDWRSTVENMALTCWPPRSPDLTPCDFFLWGCIKDRVFVPPLPVGFFYLLYYTTILLQTISTLIFYPIVHDVWSNIPVIILTLVVPISVYGAYKNLVISSIGLSHFNRLGSSFSSRTGMSSLGCVINFSR